MTTFNRRKFIQGSAALGIGATMRMPVFQAETTPDLVVVTGEDPAAATKAAIDALGGMKRFVSPGQRVFIKPNVSWDRVPKQAATTNPDVVGMVVSECVSAGASTEVGDNTLNDARRCYQRSGIGEAVEKAGGSWTYARSTDFSNLDMGGKAMGKWPVYLKAKEADVIISVPVAKHHSSARLSLGMKNLYGLVGGPRNRLHQKMDQAIADMANFFRPQLTIIDAYRVLMRNGPSGGSVADTKLVYKIIASADPVAADAMGGTLFGLEENSLGFVRAAAEHGLGTYQLATLNIKEINL